MGAIPPIRAFSIFMPITAHSKSGVVEQVMHEYKRGSLHSGPGKKHKAKSRKQAIAIALSEARRKGYR